MIGLIATLAVLSALILIGFVFRPTAGEQERRHAAAATRKGEAFQVLGAFPTRVATKHYRSLLTDAADRDLVIDWDRARSELARSSDPEFTLISAARLQIV